MQKKIILFVILFTFCFVLSVYNSAILFDTKIVNNLAFYNQQNYTKNVYSKSSNKKIKNTQNFIVSDKNDIVDILFTAINNRWDSVKFRCAKGYESCFEDFTAELSDDVEMTAINNYVHPFYQYDKISYSINIFRTITLKIQYIYSEEDIDEINNFINKLNLTSIEKINDYIVNHITYREGSNNLIDFIDKKSGDCKEISDFVHVNLFRLGYNSFVVSNETHAWNIVEINNNKLHIDSTWNILFNDEYFLLNTIELESKSGEIHKIPEIYLQF